MSYVIRFPRQPEPLLRRPGESDFGYGCRYAQSLEGRNGAAEFIARMARKRAQRKGA